MTETWDAGAIAARYELDESTAATLARYGFDVVTFDRLREELAAVELFARGELMDRVAVLVGEDAAPVLFCPVPGGD